MDQRGFVSYVRVSTDRQGRSGLGLEAQQHAVGRHIGTGRLIAEFVEIESGKRNDRPQLAAALAACRIHGARLVIAKLDRLSRDAAFLLGLQRARVDFVAADMPDANNLTVGIMALIAQHEREAISRRTIEALAAAKRRGLKLGTPTNLRNRHLGTERGNAVQKALSMERAADLMTTLEAIQQRLKESGRSATLRAIAAELNRMRVPAPRGGTWAAAQVRLLLIRLSSKSPTSPSADCNKVCR